MSVPLPKQSAESFLGLVKQSGLIEAELLKKTVKELKEAAGGLGEARKAADELIGRKLLTRWQAEKLLRGRHKGFFLGKYRLLSHLGTGGMSQVYLAEHVLMRRRVAIKVLPDSRVNDSSYLERFHREAQAVAALDHRNIVRAYDVDQEDKRHFLVMEYVSGKSLHEVVARKGPLEYVAAVEYMRQAAEGLQHAHRMGMVHRDIKPGNLLLDEKGTVKLLDLGLARFFEDKEEESLTVKHDEKVLGTADYLSPEQALDSHKVDIRSDIYSLGCTLYYLLTAHPPFPAGTLAQRLLAHQTKTPKPLTDDRPDISPDLAAIIAKMMAKKPEDRYQTARDTAQALHDWLSQNGGAAWEQMNPSVSGASQTFSVASDASSVSGLSAVDRSASSLLPAGAALNDATSAAPSSPGAATESIGTSPDETPSNSSPARSRSRTLTETQVDQELAAFLSNLDNEPSTKIARPARGVARDPQESARPAVSPVSPALEATISAPEFSAAPQAGDSQLFDVVAPPAKSTTPQPAPAHPSGEFAPTIVAEQAQAIAPTFVAESPASTAHPPASRSQTTRVAKPIQGNAIPIAKPIAQSNLAPTVALPVAAPVEAPSKKSRGGKRMLLGGSSAAILLLAAAGYALFSRSGSTDSGNAPDTGQQVAKKSAGRKEKKTKQNAEGQKVASLKGEFTVGPTGQYKSIAAALAEIKQYSNHKSRKAVQIVKVAAGQTYPERIVIDESYPRGIQIIAEPGPAPVLAPPGPEPIVVIRPDNAKDAVENFHLEGFHVEAAGKEVAVELGEWVPGAQLKGLEITGFSKAGVLVNGAQTYGDERERIVIEKVAFRNAAPTAAGILISRKTEDPRFVRINRCRFFGPLDCGVRLRSDAIGIEISESIFYKATTGVKLDGEDRTWRDVVLVSNTFFENDRALVFTNMPGGQTGDLGFYNNLFVKSNTADAVVEKDLKLIDLLAMCRSSPGGAAHNWTTRPRSNPPVPEELVFLFETLGSEFGRGDLEFVSTDPASPDFLAPASGSPQRDRGNLFDRKKFGGQIGAVRAK